MSLYGGDLCVDYKAEEEEKKKEFENQKKRLWKLALQTCQEDQLKGSSAGPGAAGVITSLCVVRNQKAMLKGQRRIIHGQKINFYFFLPSVYHEETTVQPIRGSITIAFFRFTRLNSKRC